MSGSDALVQAARGALQAQQARLTTAEATLRRVKPLTEQNALSQADLDLLDKMDETLPAHRA